VSVCRGVFVFVVVVISVMLPPVDALFAIIQKNPLEVYYLKGMLIRICDNYFSYQLGQAIAAKRAHHS